MGKKDMEDDEEDDDHVASPPQESHTPPPKAPMISHHIPNQAAFQHIRHQTPSGSPPVPNGLAFHHRHPSPQPPGISRPSSRAHIRRPSSNLVPPQHQPPSQAPPPSNGYTYMPTPSFYNPQSSQSLPPKPPPPPPHPPQYQYTHPPRAHPQVQQFLQQEQRRQSMPPAYSQERPPSAMAVPSPPQMEQNNTFQSPPLPQPKALPSAAKHSIFTPIDDSRSMLAQSWSNTNNPAELLRNEPVVKCEGIRSQSIDVASIPRPSSHSRSPPHHDLSQQPYQPPLQSSMRQQPQSSPSVPQRTESASSFQHVPPPSRTNSMQADAKRPRLKVQIPSEHSDAGSATADSSPKDSGGTGATPAKTSAEASHSSGVVLPPPSPSASALLSAGASGPPNPFARPPLPTTNGPYSARNEIETPISALPSRFVENGLLPSPSSFYQDWGFGRETNMLPSPLNFQTPVAASGPHFGREESSDRKRKTSEGSLSGVTAKKAKA